MEDVLAKIMKNASPVKHPNVRQSCLETQELLANQHELMRSPPYEVRSKCLETLQLALESKYSKLISDSLTGFQRLIWDESFQSAFEGNDEETWLPCQILHAMASLPVQNDDIQVEMLKILVQMTSTSGFSLTTRAVVHLMALCLDVYRNGIASVRTAAQATANQTLQTFCLMVQEPCENKEESCDDSEEINTVNGIIEDLLPLLTFICCKLQNNSSSEGKATIGLLLQCVLSILVTLKVDVHENKKFLSFLWQELCPRLVALLGSPKTDKNIISSQKSSSSEGNEIGRGSGCLATAPSCQSAEAKTIFSIAVQLVRLVGNIGSLRPVIESLYHRMLLYPPPQHRLEALKSTKEVFRQPELLLKFAGPPLHDINDKNSRSEDLDLIRIAMDSLGECCHSSESSVCYVSVSCAVELLRSLESICSGASVADYTNELNSLFSTLESADYKGVKSERWLQTRSKVTVIAAENSVLSNLSSDYSDSEFSDGGKSYTLAEVKPTDEDEKNHENEEKLADDGGSSNNVDILPPTKPEDENSSGTQPDVESTVKKNDVDMAENESIHFDDISSDSEKNSSSTSTALSGKAVDLEVLEAFAEQERALAEKERLNKVPQTLLGEEDAGKEERERIEKLCVARMEFAQQERENAKKFVKVLCAFLPKLLSIRSSVEADLALQEFSFKYCEELWRYQQVLSESSDDNAISQMTILNADGIYLATYSALLLNLKLLRNNYNHAKQCGEIPLTEIQFVEEVHGSGVLVYLSATWLAELYQNVLAINLLEEAGYKPNSMENSALVNLLSDVDGLGNSQPGGQQLADYSRLERAVANVQSTPNIEAGRKFSRRVMTSSWETILEVLSVLLNGTNSCGISSTLGLLLGTEGAKEEHRKAKDAIAECLDGLQRAAKLCNALGLQSSCSAVFEQLAATSCPLSDDLTMQHSSGKKDGRHGSRRILLPNRNRLLRLHTSHILSMDVILSRGLELGSHSPRCWKFVFQCCLYILQLENTYFSSCRTYSVLARPTLQVLKNAIDRKDSVQSDSLDAYGTESYQETVPMPGSAIPQQLNISEIVKKNDNVNSSGIIKDQLLLEVVEGLSQLVDRLFEEAASRLNLQALIGFLVELCAASHTQLFTESYRQLLPTPNHSNSLLLYHLGDIMLRCVRGGRPLIHIMKAWSVVAPHFVEAACHKDRMISKKAVETIHDVVSALLSSNSELPHFHFNEALFKPFENLLCLELCDTDVQEQIISSICEFVEGCTTEIRSGWRPLFGALRAVRLPGVSLPVISIESEREHVHHLRVVLDVFEAFLGTNNILVFAYAAVDCLLCLLKHVVGPAECQDGIIEQIVQETTPISIDMCLAALKYLERCSSILASMYSMPTCPVFNSANRIQLRSDPSLVDPIIPGLDIIYFDEHSTISSDEHKSDDYKEIDGQKFSYQSFNAINKLKEEVVSLKILDRHTGVLHVWFLLLEGLAGTIRSCPRRCQPHTMETFFNMLRNIKIIPGPNFGVYCINHLLLPMLQGWLRRTARAEKGWSCFTANFKQCCGLTTDLVVEYIQYISENSSLATNDESSGMNLMLEQLFVILIECVAQPSETVSRLGCACIRHVIMSAGQHFTSNLWDIMCRNLQQACYISLYSVKQLMVCFHADSDNFYGDLGEVKVAARKDSTFQESERLKQLARQVFLLDCQRGSRSTVKTSLEEERSFIFLLHPPNADLDPENSIIRVPFRNLVVGLLSHQILLQILCSILLQGSQHMLPTIMTLLSFLSPESVCSEEALPGFLSKLSSKQLHILFNCLSDSYRVACDFDSRPGLKFLIQKVAQMDVASNLYKQTGVSWATHCLALFELCFPDANLSLEKVNDILSEQSRFDSPNRTASLEETAKCGEGDHSLNGSSEKQKDFNLYISLLRKFKDLSELFTECAMDKDGLLATVDRMTDQPIFFLIAQPDSINDITDRKFEDSSGSRSDKDTQRTETAALNSCDSSDSEDLVLEDSKDKVYSLATERTISSLISEYKRRKTQHSMPSTFREKLQRKSRSSEKRKTSSEASQNSVSEEIIMQRRTSITKDGEAHIQVFKQLVQAVLELHLSLNDKQFKSFLPIFFPGVQYLVAYATDAELKLTVAEWLQRLAVCCGFGGRTRSPALEQ